MLVNLTASHEVSGLALANGIVTLQKGQLQMRRKRLTARWDPAAAPEHSAIKEADEEGHEISSSFSKYSLLVCNGALQPQPRSGLILGDGAAYRGLARQQIHLGALQGMGSRPI